jgi:hypothetical protein
MRPDWLELREHHQEQNPEIDAPLERHTKGVIIATHTGPARVDIQEGGDTSVTIPDVRYLASYTPTVGDNVWILVRDDDRLVLGKEA